MNAAVLAALNEQIKHELDSAYLYLAISAYCERRSWPGFAHWLRVQSQEEVGHALKILDFLHDRGGTVALQALEAPGTDFGAPLEIAEQALAHERKVTALIEQ